MVATHSSSVMLGRTSSMRSASMPTEYRKRGVDVVIAVQITSAASSGVAA
jgi:hypothetical protein